MEMDPKLPVGAEQTSGRPKVVSVRLSLGQLSSKLKRNARNEHSWPEGVEGAQREPQTRLSCGRKGLLVA